MALVSSSSSAPPPMWRYNVFTSFHGPDVRKTFLSHLRKQFNVNGISMFDDQKIERGQTISPALTQAIKESRISIVVLSKNYASSSWCLDELLEIFKCKEAMGQIVMTVFYGVDPSDVRKQTGEFGKVFNNTCAPKTKEKRPEWSQALKDVGNIAGEHFLNWDSESEMIEKIARDISNKLNATVSRDFEDMVGIEGHLQKLQSLLHLDYEDGAMIVGICGPAGIGKTTIARALHSRFSSNFQLTCFMENVRGSYNSGLDEYGLRLCLQEQLLSKILNQNGIRIYHLGVLPERLCDQKVLIILDDVDDLQQLEALANEPNWFGPGSRIIVTTEDQELLEQHDINNIYHVGFPKKEEARKIFCRYAFRQSLAPNGFEKLAERVTNICSNLPLGLRVMGSSLRGKREDDWECILHRLENSLDKKIEGVLRVGYDNLDKEDQLLFLLIAFFLNDKDGDHVKAMLADSNLNVILGLKNLKSKSLIQISTEGKIVMHKLLEQVGIEVVQRQDPGRRQILEDIDGICDVLEDNSGGRSVMGISCDISKLPNDVYISAAALQKMRNLRFLKICKTRDDTNVTMHVPEEMDFPTQLRLLHWEKYPGNRLPNTFRPENLVELNMENNRLEKLWEGIQPLKNLKKMSLLWSSNLKELPNLSNATNLEKLELSYCSSLVEIPSSIGNLHKLEDLLLQCCVKLQVVPTHFNLASLKRVDVLGCWQLRKNIDISKNITELRIADTMLEDLLGSIWVWSRLQVLFIFGSVTSYHLHPLSVDLFQKRRGADIERIQDSIKDLHELKRLFIIGCPKLALLPELPRSLKMIIVSNCESLETLIPFESPIQWLSFINCSKLGEEARRVITQQSSAKAWLPGRNIPTEFNHRAFGNSLTIPSKTDEFRICLVFPPTQRIQEYAELLCRDYIDGILVRERKLTELPWIEAEAEHLYIYRRIRGKPDGELLLEFIISSENIDIIECGLQILSYQTDERGEAWVPGRNIPAAFNHRGIGNSLTIPSKTDEFSICVVISPQKPMSEPADLLWRGYIDGILTWVVKLGVIPEVGTEHLFISHHKFHDRLNHELLLEFTTSSQDIDIIECGLWILTYQTDGRRSSHGSNESRSEQVSDSKVSQNWQSREVCLFLPGRCIPAKFHHRAIGNSLTIPSWAYEYRICLVISPKEPMLEDADLFSCVCINGRLIQEEKLVCIHRVQTEHILILGPFRKEGKFKVMIKFSTTSKEIDIIECGLQILTGRKQKRSRKLCVMDITSMCSSKKKRRT